MSLLSDEEIKAINAYPWGKSVDYARAVESAVLDKLESYADSNIDALFRPIPADDVVRQRDELLAALKEARGAIIRAIVIVEEELEMSGGWELVSKAIAKIDEVLKK